LWLVVAVESVRDIKPPPLPPPKATMTDEKQHLSIAHDSGPRLKKSKTGKKDKRPKSYRACLALSSKEAASMLKRILRVYIGGGDETYSLSCIDGHAFLSGEKGPTSDMWSTKAYRLFLIANTMAKDFPDDVRAILDGTTKECSSKLYAAMMDFPTNSQARHLCKYNSKSGAPCNTVTHMVWGNQEQNEADKAFQVFLEHPLPEVAAGAQHDITTPGTWFYKAYVTAIGNETVDYISPLFL
jgi:hypothetical protein